VLECQKGLELLRDKRFEKFWSRLIVFHLSHLFHDYWCDTKQGRVQIIGLDLGDVVTLSNTQGERYGKSSLHTFHTFSHFFFFLFFCFCL
jgi:hypothetical protein